MSKPKTLGELKHSGYGEQKYKRRTVKDEMREHVIEKLRTGEPLFPGIFGYEETVIPQMVNAILSKHNMVLLGLRGQAKSRILRGLTNFLDEEIPVLEGCEINDNPYLAICRACKLKLREFGDETPITFLSQEARYVEKLATPDVTIADMIGDVDPIKAARGGLHLADELTIHFGLLPRANRGIFAINEVPDLAGKIQVGLFNIMQEGDVQIKGYPIRLPLDVVLVFTANPEDYTARGKIITPLKDRIGSEIRTHYPTTLQHGLSITEQEAWIRRDKNNVILPDFIKEIVEEIAFQARKDQRVDKRSGVSQRLPITCLENVLSNAEQRALVNKEKKIVPRIIDVYASLPSITGKLELEYEGEMQGGETVAKDIIRVATGQVFTRYCGQSDFRSIVEWFDLGGSLKLGETARTTESLRSLEKIQGLVEKASSFGIDKANDDLGLVVSACEFILEGLYAQKKINRSEERGYAAAETRRTEPYYDELSEKSRKPFKKPYN